jgi:Tfp pilus tip-associated adhesin PilY1
MLALLAALAAGGALLCTSTQAAPLASFVPNNQPTGWVGPVAVSSFNFGLDNQFMFRGDYERGNYSGNLWADQVDVYGSVTGSPWDGGAAGALDAQNYDTGRLIVTRNVATNIGFRWNNLSNTQKTSINSNATTGQDMLNFIRGQRTKEKANGGTFRNRSSAMGDIIHSRPLFVADPSTSPPDPALARVFVGGNDGMLHAFDACMDGCSTAGKEVWAYIPSMLISNLKLLTVDPYAHQYFVDGGVNARKVTISGNTSTILVGTLGAGGIGMYALDVSNPSPADETTAAGFIKWEITNSTVNNSNNNSYADMGYIYGPPLIVQLNDASHTWAAIVGNGYNNVNNSGRAALFVINLDTGALIRELTVPNQTGQAVATPNGLGRPAALDVNGDGYVDYIYAGDICGNLWKFDLRSTSTGSWSNPTTALFTNPAAQPNTNAITGAPSIAPHPSGGRIITFGTGRLFASTDITDVTQQYVYGVRDNDIPAPGTNLAGTTIDTTKLVSQTLSNPISYSGNTLTATIRTSGATINPVDYATKQGWRLSLASGERVVGDGGYISDYRYQFSTANPNKSNGNDANGNPLAAGDNWLIEVDMLTGAAPTSPFLDLNADQSIDTSDLAPGTGSVQSRVPISRQLSIGGVISQPILAQLQVQSQTYFNINPDAVVAAANNSGGVVNGHFDFDIYYGGCSSTTDKKGNASYSCKSHTHKHQYDDIYNVTGVDMQNASLPAMNLVNAIPSTSTKFKILIANQRLSPAANVQIGDSSATYRPVTQTQISGWPLLDVPPSNLPPLTTTSFSVNSLPTYSRGGVSGTTKLQNFYIKLPLDSFVQKDWTKYWATSGNSGGTCTASPNTWTAGGSMGTSRQLFTTTLLGSTGKVLAAGGTNGSAAVASAEVYDPTANTWGTTGSMTTARQNHAATLLSDGRVLVMGGLSGSTALSSAEIYDPATATWTSTGAMSAARQFPVATLLASGKVLVTGGLGSSGTALNTAEVYNPATGTWSATSGNMAAARAYHTATLLADGTGKVFLAGGINATSTVLNTTEIYDPTANTFTNTTKTLATARHHHVAVLIPVSGKVLLTGGTSGGTTVLATAELFTPGTSSTNGTIATGGTMTSAREYHTATMLATNGKVLVTGGATTTAGTTALATTDLYDPIANTWATGPVMTGARLNHAAVQLATGKVLSAGSGTSDAYDPDTNCRVGLVPSQTGCITSNQGGITDDMSFGPYGNLWMNGALTIQVIKDTTPDSAIRLASTSGDPTFGYRLATDATSQGYQLAQYTIFWHHPNGKCYGDAGWGTTAAIAYPDEAGAAKSAAVAAGSDDPTDGTFEGIGGGTGTGGTTGGSGGTNTTVQYITLADGTVITQTITKNADGTITVTLVGPDGQPITFTLTQPAGRQHDTRITSGRMSWRELVR